MTLQEILDLTWVPLLVFAICLYYGVWLIVTKKPDRIVSKKNPKPIFDPQRYAVEAGKLLLGLAVASIINCVLLFFNIYVALAEAVLSFVLFSIAWKKMDKIYGSRE